MARDKRSGLVRKLTIVDTAGNKLVIDLSKRSWSLAIKSLAAPLDGPVIEIELSIAGRRAVLLAPLRRDPVKPNRATIGAARGAVLPAP